MLKLSCFGKIHATLYFASCHKLSLRYTQCNLVPAAAGKVNCCAGDALQTAVTFPPTASLGPSKGDEHGAYAPVKYGHFTRWGNLRNRENARLYRSLGNVGGKFAVRENCVVNFISEARPVAR